MRMRTLLFLLYCARVSKQNFEEVLQERYTPAPPHCSRVYVTEWTQSNPSPSWTSTFKLGLAIGQTICFKYNDSDALDLEGRINVTRSDATLRSNNILHVLTLTRLEQYYPIPARYRFAYPEVRTKCRCVCDRKSEQCRFSDYEYKQCPHTQYTASGSSEACYRTFFPMPLAAGCQNDNSALPRLCCESHFRPYQGRTFTALRLEAPTTVAVLNYSAFSWTPNGWWKVREPQVYGVMLDGSEQRLYLDSSSNIEFSTAAPSSSANQLESGMYFVENFAPGQYSQLFSQPLNDKWEQSFEKLGWFRFSEDGNEITSIHNGELLMKELLHVTVENCVEQEYTYYMDATYYINANFNATTPFEMADMLNQRFPWISSARIMDEAQRHAIVAVNDGTNIEIALTAHCDCGLAFVHNTSRIDDFHATIFVDRYSNAMLNITAYNASGVLHGSVQHVDDVLGKTTDTFSVFTSEPGESAHVRGPQKLVARVGHYTANTVYKVCLFTSEGPRETKVCRFVLSVHEERKANTHANQWIEEKGNCPECDKSVDDDFMKYIDAFFYLLLFFIFVIFAKYLLEILQCCFCPFLNWRNK